ncbi:sugar ABC transporter ATP-binding protein [Aminobacter sp. AP02]|uniref:sugar ABC transporter ATP-binding protein n=1 Tax=Aminobacter sp. AP02 TaxID=2135737 RepID=UPI000D6AC133|nr:sugar ABC transporter ATP-binding protein [Aminobacter sp. AP02]PWK70557.1 monosaccharide ABC transporter ATP-binding protein (CUT2 family) [Aminobacter sp. AP02]
MSKIELRGVSKAYGATLALRRGDLSIDAGEVHVLIGSNGSGKSTLCKVLAGSVRPDGGEILIDGKPVTITGPRSARDHGIGIFYQELSLAGHRTVAENICLPDLPATAAGFVDRAALETRAARYIALFDTVSGDGFSADTTVENLRADQRQLVEIMKALATEAPVLIFDEPTSALDRAQVDRFFEILRDLKKQGRSIIFISHRMDEIFAIGDRVTVIRDGETVGTEKISDTNPAAVIRMMVGGQDELAAASSAPPAVAASGRPIALALNGLSGKNFANVSFEVAKGEILGFGGLHGQGQSAVLRAIFGVNPVASGEIMLNGTPFQARNPRDAIRRGCAYVSGDRGRDGVISGRPILENVTPIHYLRQKLKLASPSALAERVKPALEALHTKFGGLSHPINSLSGGNQQKIVIARWLIDRPDVLLLDDPTKGIDLSAKADLFSLIRKLAAEGMGIVLYSSEDAELLNNADRILVFNGGQVRRELTGADRTRYNLYQAAYEAA